MSRKTTSTPGATRDTTCASTASAIELVTQNRAPNVVGGPLDDLLGRRALQPAGRRRVASSTQLVGRGSDAVGSGHQTGRGSHAVIGTLPLTAVRELDREDPGAGAALPGAVRRLVRAQVLLAAVRAVQRRRRVASLICRSLLVGPDHPVGERLAVGAAGQVAAGQPLHVRREAPRPWS